VRDRLAAAAQRAGRDPGAVTLVAVTKGQGVETVRALWTAGQRDFGENRVQEAVTKMELDLPGARWHLIGHLQENKINKILPQVFMIQSIDTLSLGRAVSWRAERLGRRVPVLLEVKTSPEPSKRGVELAQAEETWGRLTELAGLEPCGLMTLAPFGAGGATVRACFRDLVRLHERLAARPGGSHIVSMGMSDDFEIAIEEGSTMVRIGRALVAA
jgi:pyridoxal phosphate enzyme (YggS family)